MGATIEPVPPEDDAYVGRAARGVGLNDQIRKCLQRAF
jgi:hypothetical protein